MNRTKLISLILIAALGFTSCSNHIMDITDALPQVEEQKDSNKENSKKTTETGGGSNGGGTSTPTPTPQTPSAVTYKVTIERGITNGTISVNKSTAAAGETITITVNPDSGYELNTLTVTDSDDNSITVTNKTFEMPESSVTVNATFRTAISITLKNGDTIHEAFYYDEWNNPVKKILHSATPPADSITTRNIARADSTPCYVWRDGDTVYYYAEGFTDSNPSVRRMPLPEDCSYLFYGNGFEDLEEIDLAYFDTSNVTNMRYMFGNCPKLKTLNVSHFDTSDVTNMMRMFYNCNSLTSLDVSNFNTSNVTNMQEMFCYCGKLTSLDLSNFDTSNVTDMYMMFYNCRKITSLDVSNFDTSNVINMEYMFGNCNDNLTTLDLSGFDTSSVTNMQGMFCNNYQLSKIEVSNSFITNNVTSSNAMFKDCTSLIGGSGTAFDSNHTDKEYARIDGGQTSTSPGYFTLKQ